jgi:3-oxoadipate enol-lactonase
MLSLDVNGTTLHYTDDGPRDAPALVLSHSLFFDHAMFDAQVEAFAGEYRVVRYDHRGQGASARAPREQLDMDTLTDDAAALIQALELSTVTFLGNSMGGFVALRLAARRPDLIAGAVVAGSSADVEEQIAAFDPLVEAMGQGGVEPVLDAVTHIMLGDRSMAERTDLTAQVRERLARLGPEIADPAWQVVHREAVLDELGGVRVPVLVLAGEEDHAYPPAKSQQIAERIADARLEVVPGVGHSVMLEDPERANAHVREHLLAAASAARPPL